MTSNSQRVELTMSNNHGSFYFAKVFPYCPDMFGSYQDYRVVEGIFSSELHTLGIDIDPLFPG